ESFRPIGALDDFSFELWQDLRQGLLKVRPLVATIGKELFQERVHPEKGRKKQGAAIAILDIGRMNDGVQQQTQRVYENMALLALDLFARLIAMRIDAAPFSSAPHASAIDDGGGRAGFSFTLLPIRHTKRVMDAIQRAV